MSLVTPAEARSTDLIDICPRSKLGSCLKATQGSNPDLHRSDNMSDHINPPQLLHPTLSKPSLHSLSFIFR